MISNILLDLQATVNNPTFRWPVVDENTKGVIIEGYKFTLILSDMELGVPNQVTINDADNFPIELPEHQIMCLMDWVMENVIPNYLVMN